MGFIIATESRFNEDQTVFMADRKKVRRSCWWTTELSEAFVFESETAAASKARSFRFNSPRILTEREARRIEDEQTDHEDVHPFSEDAFLSPF